MRPPSPCSACGRSTRPVLRVGGRRTRRGVFRDCFNCETAKRAPLAKANEIRVLGLKRFQQCEEHREPGRRFMLHGVPTRVFFHCGNVSAGTGWLSSKRQ